MKKFIKYEKYFRYIINREIAMRLRETKTLDDIGFILNMSHTSVSNMIKKKNEPAYFLKGPSTELLNTYRNKKAFQMSLSKTCQHPDCNEKIFRKNFKKQQHYERRQFCSQKCKEEIISPLRVAAMKKRAAEKREQQSTESKPCRNIDCKKRLRPQDYNFYCIYKKTQFCSRACYAAAQKRSWKLSTKYYAIEQNKQKAA